MLEQVSLLHNQLSPVVMEIIFQQFCELPRADVDHATFVGSKWYKDDVEIPGETGTTLSVSEYVFISMKKSGQTTLALRFYQL